MVERGVADRDDDVAAQLEAVRRYLQDEFPDRQVFGPAEDSLRDTVVFTLPGAPPYHVSVSYEFVSDHPPQEIRDLLREWGLASMVRGMPRRRVTVTRAGLRLEAS